MDEYKVIVYLDDEQIAKFDGDRNENSTCRNIEINATCDLHGGIIATLHIENLDGSVIHEEKLGWYVGFEDDWTVIYLQRDKRNVVK